ncbi:auxin-responsive protein SAUR15-like [Bidens hawaiensis]|uniref:auxin-responsive protein SAUR15-like n=1 Tax=Bidens hawaiensis TaxID=980011 RepID=UPI00404A2508
MNSSANGRSTRKKPFRLKTWVRSFLGSGNKKVAPEGCFPVYVGPERQRFAVKMMYANHPLFQILLEDAEIKYGYNTPGPILLPCEVDLFYKVVGEIEAKETEPHGCGFGYRLFRMFNLGRGGMVKAGDDMMGKGYGGYGVLTPSRLVKMN